MIEFLIDEYIKNVEKVDDEFHARFNAIGKEYVYIINMGEHDPIYEDYIYNYGYKLDVKSMKKSSIILALFFIISTNSVLAHPRYHYPHHYPYYQ